MNSLGGFFGFPKIKSSHFSHFFNKVSYNQVYTLKLFLRSLIIIKEKLCGRLQFQRRRETLPEAPDLPSTGQLNGCSCRVGKLYTCLA